MQLSAQDKKRVKASNIKKREKKELVHDSPLQSCAEPDDPRGETP